MIHGLKSNGQGPVVECLWSGSGFGDLITVMHDIARGRVRELMIEGSWVGSGLAEWLEMFYTELVGPHTLAARHYVTKAGVFVGTPAIFINHNKPYLLN